jgi:hypothetical protein
MNEFFTAWTMLMTGTQCTRRAIFRRQDDTASRGCRDRRSGYMEFPDRPQRSISCARSCALDAAPFRQRQQTRPECNFYAVHRQYPAAGTKPGSVGGGSQCARRHGPLVTCNLSCWHIPCSPNLHE